MLDEVLAARRLEVAAPAKAANHQIPLSDVTERTEADVLVDERGVDGTGWVVAVLDSGVKPAHSALNGKIIAEACFSTHDPDNPEPNLRKWSACFGGISDPQHPKYGIEESTEPDSALDCGSFHPGCGHGTAMAGLIAANSANLRGMAPGAKLIPIQVYSKNNTQDGYGGEWPDIATGLEHVYSLRNTYNIAAANMSLGTETTFTSACDDANGGLYTATAAAAANLRSVGIIPVAGTGNESKLGIASPSCISHVVSVGAIAGDPYTPTDFSNRHTIMDFWSPGHGAETTTQSGGTGHSTGTSAATAVMSGAIALLRSGYPGVVRNQTILDAVKSAGTNIPGEDLNKPRPALDLALPPTQLLVASFPCSGSAAVSWGGTLPDFDQFRVLSSLYPFQGLWHPEWVGTGTSANITVDQTSYIGVQAALGNRLGGIHESAELAHGPC